MILRLNGNENKVSQPKRENSLTNYHPKQKKISTQTKIAILTLVNISLLGLSYFYSAELKIGAKVIQSLTQQVISGEKIQYNSESLQDFHSTSQNTFLTQQKLASQRHLPITLLSQPPASFEALDALFLDTAPPYKYSSTYSSSTQAPGLEDGKSWWDYPNTIITSIRDGDDYLVLVNKRNQLPTSYTPTDLVQINVEGIRTVKARYIRSIVVDPLKAMGSAAKADGIDLLATSTYRSYSTQKDTYNYWLGRKGSKSEADKISARAGHSQHQLGTTIDFASSDSGNRIGTVFNGTNAQLWLAENSWRYGFIIGYPENDMDVSGYSYESWHYRWIGVNNAKVWKESGLSLEVWLRGLNDIGRGWGG